MTTKKPCNHCQTTGLTDKGFCTYCKGAGYTETLFVSNEKTTSQKRSSKSSMIPIIHKHVTPKQFSAIMEEYIAQQE